MIPRKQLLWQCVRSLVRSYRENTSILDTVVDLYGLERGRVYRPAGDGFSSKTYIVKNRQGVWALKQYRKQIQQQDVLFIHSLLAQLEKGTFPSSRLCLTPDGHDFVAMNGHYYALFGYESGYRGDLFKMIQPLKQRHVKQAGIELARFHRLTENMILPGRRNQGYKAVRTSERWDPYDGFPGEWRELVSRSLQIKDEDTMVSDAVSKYITGKLTDLAQKKKDQPLSAVSVIHGDYGPWNLLFRPFAVLNSIIDFDDVSLEERVEEVASSLISFASDKSRNKINIEDGRAFLEGYHKEYPLTPVELQALPGALESSLLKRALAILRMYVQLRQKADRQKLFGTIYWLNWLDNSGFTVLQKITSPILNSALQIEAR